MAKIVKPPVRMMQKLPTIIEVEQENAIHLDNLAAASILAVTQQPGFTVLN